MHVSNFFATFINTVLCLSYFYTKCVKAFQFKNVWLLAKCLISVHVHTYCVNVCAAFV